LGPAGKGSMEHTKGTWEATRFLKFDGSEIKTISDVAETLSLSAQKSENVNLYGITIHGDERIICYTGNGIQSEDNALFIARACNCHDDLLKACMVAKELLETIMDQPRPTIEQLKAAIAKATEG